MKQDTLYAIAKSWFSTGGEAYSIEEILEWVAIRNKTVAVDIRKNTLSESGFWFYDKQQGTIHNRNNSFFSIAGFEKRLGKETMIRQPVILQQEIGFLGIIFKSVSAILVASAT